MPESPDTNPIPLPSESLLPPTVPAAPADAWPEEYGSARGPWEPARPSPPAAPAPGRPGPARELPRPEELLTWGGFTTALAVLLTLVTGAGVPRAIMLGLLGAAATGVLWCAARFGKGMPERGTGRSRTGA